ncbi:MAG: glycosyltransferase [bacterium]
MTAVDITAWVSLALLFWVYVGYPVFLWLHGNIRFVKKRSTPGYTPSVSLIIPTYNESIVIRKKIENVRSLVYPKRFLEVFIADSGSTDGTSAIVSTFAPDFRLITSSERGGKAKAINDILPLTKGEVIVVTDANSFMDADALQKVIDHFVDNRVGACTGAMRQIDRSKTAVSEGGGWYWKMETFMRKRESQLHSVIAMSGEMSAFRRSLFVNEKNVVLAWYKPGGTDDFEMTLFVIQKKYHVAYAPDAYVWEFAPDTLKDLYSQKVRIIVQTIVSVQRNVRVLWTTGWYGAMIFLSRKILPLFSPWALIVLYGSSFLLALYSKWWLAFFLVQTAGYLLALASRGLISNNGLAKLAFFFCLLNGTVFIAWIQFWEKRDYTRWQPIESSRRL